MAEYRDTDPSSSPDARDVLRAATDALIDPHALLQAVRNPDGQVVDFTFIDVNPAVSEYLKRGHHDLIGSSLVEILPDIESSGLLQRYDSVPWGGGLRIGVFSRVVISESC